MSAAIASYRRARAVELATAGYSYEEIAREVGYANRGTAWHTVQRELRDRRADAVDAYREAELLRLDALWRQLEGRLRSGQLRAVQGLLGIVDRRMRLMGLDQMATRGSNSCTCDCPVHGIHGSWRPTLQSEDALVVEEPGRALVDEVEERMQAWADEVGIWMLFQMMTVNAQIMELSRRGEELSGSA